MATNVPAPSFTSTGFQSPDDVALLEGSLADLQAAFGGALNPDLTTPQGQLATSLAAILSNVDDLFALYVAQVDPAFATGRMQDAIARIYFLSRLPARPTVVTATINGAPGTLLPAGTLAQAADGTIYQSLGAATIAANATVDVEFAALTPGPVVCPAGTLNRVYRAVPGWDAITNAEDGVLGRYAETRAEFEARRAASVSLNATGILPALRGAVLNVPDVLDAYVTENPSGSTVTVGGVSLPPHSLYVAASGGTDEAVARAIWTKKPPGCDYTGNTAITVVDNGSGYVSPYPSYDVLFTRPDPLPVYVAVELANTTGVPSNAVTLVRAAVLSAFTTAARIGGTLYASRFYGPVYALGAWAQQIVSIKVGTSSPAAADELTAHIDQVPTLSANDVTVTLA